MEPLPDRTEADDLVLRRWTPDDAAALDALVTANLAHLRPRMPWIAEEPKTLAERRELIEGWTASWAGGGDLVMGVWRGDRPVASVGLHWRGEPDGPEVGYWVAGPEQGRGIATRASAALCDLAFGVPTVDAVYLANDATNLASRRVPEKLGFTHLGQVPVPAEKIAPADSGVHDRWRLPRPDWPAHRPTKTRPPARTRAMW